MDNVDLTSVLCNTETASRDAKAAFDATERLVLSIGPRFDAIESRLTSLESRAASIERGIDGVVRSNHRIEEMLGDIFARLGP